MVWKRGDDGEIVHRRSPDGGVGFEAAVNLSGTESDSAEPRVAAVGDQMHLVWAEAFLDDDGRPDPDVDADEVYGRSSTDRGATFAERVNVSDTTDEHTRDPDIAATDAFIGVAFEESLSDTDDDIFFRRSTDGGASWSAPVNLSGNPGDCGAPSVVAAGDAVYVAWSDTTTGRSDILLRRSTDGGATFQPIQNVSGTRGNSEDVSLAVDATSGVVHLVWTDYSIDTPPPAQASGSPPRGASPAGGPPAPPSGTTTVSPPSPGISPGCANSCLGPRRSLSDPGLHPA